MSGQVAIQMDHVSTIGIDGDSSFVMGLEAQRRGYKLWHYEPQDLSYSKGRVVAVAQEMELRRELGNHFTLGEKTVIDLADIDVVLMRQDPPFDMSYISATHLLDLVHPKTLVVNNPSEVRNAPEKLFMLKYPDLLAPTMISRDAQAIRDFRDEQKDIIVKPLFGNGGAGVFHIAPGDENLNSLLEMFAGINREPLMIQKYLHAVRAGDKRIILIDGVPVGGTNRVPQVGEARSNMHVGGQAEKTQLTEREHEICEAIGPNLKNRGLIFVGIDVIGGFLTEINVTSPTGLQEVNAFDDVCLESDLWDAIETRL
ncbi:MAG: glutathione synthase [Rhodospirillales bacterium]|nr:glutathione synthase [Rhodospirillales bacterium]